MILALTEVGPAFENLEIHILMVLENKVLCVFLSKFCWM